MLTLRSSTEKFWDKACQELPSPVERNLPLFDDIFVMALISFNGPTTGFSQEHIQDELTDLSSQTLNIDYNTVVLVTDARAQNRTSILGIYVLISQLQTRFACVGVNCRFSKFGEADVSSPTFR